MSSPRPGPIRPRCCHRRCQAASAFGGGSAFNSNDPRQIVTLPGSGFFSFPDQWEPVLTTDPNGVHEPQLRYRELTTTRRSRASATCWVTSAAPKTGSPGVGFGSNPFIDIGAYQYVNLHPPEVTSVTETPTPGRDAGELLHRRRNRRAPTRRPGRSTSPSTARSTPTRSTPTRSSSSTWGATPAQPLNQDINLAGKLAYDSATDTLIINLAAAGLTLGTDAYQITLFGSGSPVITNPQGIALDGENTVGGTSTGAQLALPSGNGYPGGNFFDSFIINTTPPSVLAGSLKLDPASDTNIVGDNITSSTSPTFDGTVSEPNPTSCRVAGQTAILDVGIAVLVNGVLTTYFDPTQLPSSLANLAQYIRQNAGTGVSTTGGAFQVTVGVDAANTGLVTNTAPLPDLQGIYNVGPDGLLSPLPGDDSGYYVARVRVIDQSGNQSNPNDPNAQSPFVVDHDAADDRRSCRRRPARSSPACGRAVRSTSRSRPARTSIRPHFTAASISSINAGPDGVLGTADDVTVPIDPNSITFTLLDKGTGGQGREMISLLDPGHADQQPLSGHAPQHRCELGPRHRGQRAATPAASEQFAVAVPSLAHNLFVGGQAFVTDPTAADRQPGEPVPDHRRRHDGGLRRRRRRRPARRLHRAGHDEAVRAAALG